MISIEGWAILWFLFLETILMGISLWIQCDDVYGWSAIRKTSKRALRRYWKKFWNDTMHYHKVTK